MNTHLSTCEACNTTFDHRDEFELSEEEARDDDGEAFVSLCGECYDESTSVTPLNRSRIYVAGPYRSPNICEVLNNMRRGIHTCAALIANGYAAFCPWLDHHYGLSNEGDILNTKDYQENSLAWLEVADALLVLPGWENSQGTTAEIKRATELEIPVFYTLSNLIKEIPTC